MPRMMHHELAGIHIVGTSVGGEESVVAAPEHNVCFDVGRAPRDIIPIDNVCITHGHMDHAAGVAYYLSQRNFVGCPPGRVIVPRGIAQSVQKLMDIWGDIERHPSPGQIVGVEHLEEVELRRGLAVRAFTVNHGPDSLGFSLIEKRHKLKTEFVGKTGPELVALKRQGVAIEQNFEVSLLSYPGDTALGRFLELDFVRASKGVLLECTFFERDHMDRARAGRHMHVTDLPRALEAISEAQVMLIHVTRRTDLREAKRIAKQILKPADRERVSFLMDRPNRPGPERPEVQPSTTNASSQREDLRVKLKPSG